MSSSSTGNWFDAEAEGLRGTIEEFGEWFQLQPYSVARVNFPSQPDTSRSPVFFQAVFERDAKDVSLGMEEVNVSTRHLCVTALVCDVPGISQGDRLVHYGLNPNGPPGDVFEITDPRPDGLSGIELRMVQLGRSKQ